MTCGHCGVTSEPDANFCTQCGRPLETPYDVAVDLRDELAAMTYRWAMAHGAGNDPESVLDLSRDLSNNLVEGLRGSWTFQRRD